MLITNNKSCSLIEQYLNYLTIFKGRSDNTIDEYRNDLLMFFRFLKDARNLSSKYNDSSNFNDIDIDFIKSISINDMYSFVANFKQFTIMLFP
jgi:integrase/recombinase XerD